MTVHPTGLMPGFLSAARTHADRPALAVDGREVTYGELALLAGRLAGGITAVSEPGPLTAVFAARSLSAYAGLLAALMAGRGYVPLNRNFPAERSRTMLTLSGCRTVIADPVSLPALAAVLEGLDTPLTLLLPEADSAGDWAGLPERFPGHRFLTARDLPADPAPPDAGADDSRPAYLLVTSGSTGAPKGVPVSRANAAAYIDYVTRRYAVAPEDRLSQMFDLTFDLSVHDIFLALTNGACLCVPPESALVAPARFIREQRLTMWFSVPSAAMFMDRLRMLKADAFPTLRWSLFCGEALPAATATAWQKAAPASVVENLYGPTEATIAITHYRWDFRESPSLCRNGLTPIGTAFAGQRAVIVDADGRPLPPEQPGELCLAGTQVTTGYWNDPVKTADRFQELPLCGPGVWYRTGDRAVADGAGVIHYLGRLDHQVKILGHRVELAEIEHHLRKAAGRDLAACVPWPVKDGLAGAVYAFVAGPPLDEETVRRQLAAHLPEYMVPRRVLAIPSLPLNPNGKIDRPALIRLLEEMHHDA